jgi:4,5-DOPA dioxygenase extradiol
MKRAEITNEEQPSMPVLVVGHGTPMNAIAENRWSRGFGRLAGLVPRPRAILAISAHWYVNGILVTGNERPRTIHDFGGFPQDLYDIEYPSPGDPALAERVRALVGERRCSASLDWGLDHGAWSVLRRAYPEAEVPVVQLSIDRRLEVGQHLELASKLAPLRREGVLIFCSGNATHNLKDAFARVGNGDDQTPAWARRFDEALVDVALERDTERLLALWPGCDDGRLAHPSGEHYLPWVYAYGAADRDDEVGFPIEGFDMGSISMRAFLFG